MWGDNRDYLDQIAMHVRPRLGRRPERKDLPEKVFEIVQLLKETEILVFPPRGRCEQGELLIGVQNLVKSRKTLTALVDSVKDELLRIVNRPRTTGKSLIDDIVPEMKAIITLLGAIQQRPNDDSQGKIPFHQLHQHISQLLGDYHGKIISGHEIDSIAPEVLNIENLTFEVASRQDHQASHWENCEKEKEQLQLLHKHELEQQREYVMILQRNLEDDKQQYNASQSLARKRLQEFEVQCREYEARCQKHEAESVALKSYHAQTLAEQRQFHSKELDRVKAEKLKKLDDLRERFDRKSLENEREWKTRLEKAERDHGAAESQWEEELRQEKARNAEKVEGLIEKYNKEIQTLQTELRIEKANTAKQVQEEARRHNIANEKLKKEYQNLHGILLRQDDYTGLRDLEIVRGVSSRTGKVPFIGFASMVSKVTTFSEWEWREDQQTWSEEIMTAMVGTKQRRLKKLILGNAIWTALFRLIFDSPFRILGEEGDRLEADWTRSFPTGMTIE